MPDPAPLAPDQPPGVERTYTDVRRQRVRTISGFEQIVLAHFGVLVTVTAWDFGGQAPSARAFLLAWGTLGIGLFVIAAWINPPRPNTTPLYAARHLWPLVLFDVIVGLSCLNPSFKETVVNGEGVYALVPPPHAWLPSSARPPLTLRELWLVNGIVLSCACLYLGLQSRRAIRLALFSMAANGLALAVFGTFQKLLHAKGLWFGLVPSPQPLFFSTFIYHNHWGAFTLLNTSALLALLFHYIRQGRAHRDVWHSPAFGGAVATLLLAASVPLSASRSSTLLVLLLLFVATAHFLFRLVRKRREQHESAALPAAALVAALVIAVAGTYYLSREVVAQRSQLTVEQVAAMRDATDLNSRLRLYADTWRMATEKIWFGWGLETYANVFFIFNTAYPKTLHGQWRPFYAEAHNDWFQSVAEVGLVGTGLLLLLGLLPLRTVRWRSLESILPRYLLGGCALALLYAWVEFPFANPAVMITFWACFFSAVRYAQIDQGLAASTPPPHV